MAVAFVTPKDPDDVDDFTLDWTARLGTGETVSTFTATVLSGGVSISASSNTTTTTTARITGGTDGTPATVRYRVVTSLGRQLDQTVTIPVTTQ